MTSKTKQNKDKDKEEDIIKDVLIPIVLGGLAIFSIKSIFEHDNSTIVSKRGKKFLSGTNTMEELNKKIDSEKSVSKYKETYF